MSIYLIQHYNLSGSITMAVEFLNRWQFCVLGKKQKTETTGSSLDFHPNYVNIFMDQPCQVWALLKWRINPIRQKEANRKMSHIMI